MTTTVENKIARPFASVKSHQLTLTYSAYELREASKCFACLGPIPPARRAEWGEASYFCSDACHQNCRHLFWEHAQALAITRAGGRCDHCGGPGPFEVHHIQPLDGTFYWLHQLHMPTNLIVLCHLCHRGPRGPHGTQPKALRHHNRRGDTIKTLIRLSFSYYGVASPKIEHTGTFNRTFLSRRWLDVRDCLAGPLGLTTAQREAVFRLLELEAHYHNVYPKAGQIAEQPGCCRATFWRTVAMLEARGLLQVVNRYIRRPHAQISNLYDLSRLVIVIMRYLAEHGMAIFSHYLTPFFEMSGAEFWHGWLLGPQSGISRETAGTIPRSG